MKGWLIIEYPLGTDDCTSGHTHWQVENSGVTPEWLRINV